MGKAFRWTGAGIAAILVVACAWAGAGEWRGRRAYLADMERVPAAHTEDSGIRLRDGRLLGFTVQGPANGTPVLYFHGALGSRLEWPATGESAERAGVRVIAVDRPGYGCSDPQRGRRLLDWPDDVRQLADRLRIGKFRIIGWSAGSPYALACGYRLADRITRIDLVGAVVPESYPDGRERRDRDLSFFASLAQYAPGTAYAMLRTTVIRRETDPEWFEERLARSLSDPDRSVTRDPAIRPILMRSHAAGQSRIAVGLVGDLETLGREWGFAPSQVRVPVVMWQGSEDTLTPAARNARLTRELPVVKLKSFPGEGHFLLYRHERELLEN
jgi:pimeloyl-ACP methyl ester carboxylesterase